MDAFVAELRKIPPVTRFLCASSLSMTIPVILNLVSAYELVFIPQFVLKKLQVWRIFTSFFLGSGGINYIFEIVMLYRTSDQLESSPYTRRSADYAWQLLLASAAIMIVSAPLSSSVYTRPFLLCITYLSSALAPPGAQSSFFGLITLPISYLPYVMIGMDLLMGGPGAAAQAIAGAVVGHLWWWGVWGTASGGRGGVLEAYGRAPRWMKKLLGEDASSGPSTGVANAGVAGGVHVTPPRRNLTAAGVRPAGSSTTTTTTTGYNWGSGQRLGSN